MHFELVMRVICGRVLGHLVYAKPAGALPGVPGGRRGGLVSFPCHACVRSRYRHPEQSIPEQVRRLDCKWKATSFYRGER